MTNCIPIFAHRGASGYALENTLKAFEKARKLGADGIEIDIQLTKDHELIVYHDLDLFRLTGKRKKINECTYKELLNYPIGKHFFRKYSKERIPTFQQVVEWANGYQIPLNVELKESFLENTGPLITALQRVVLPEGSHFSSFHDELLRIVKMQRPDFQTAYIVTRKFDWNQLQSLSHIDVIHANKKYYKPSILDAVERAKKSIRFYSVNGNESFLSNPHPSVIGWITDYPDRVAKAEKRKKENRRSI